jgi:hypothetical protein
MRNRLLSLRLVEFVEVLLEGVLLFLQRVVDCVDPPREGHTEGKGDQEREDDCREHSFLLRKGYHRRTLRVRKCPG